MALEGVSRMKEEDGGSCSQSRGYVVWVLGTCA